MATTQNTFTGDGSTTNYSFTFEYIKEADVKATLDGTATTAFTLANATTLSFTTAPANGVAIRIFRDTDINSLKATFFPGSAIKAEDLNDNFTQNNFAVQEADFNVDTANATADTAKTNSETAIATSNTASTNASAAVATANTADTNASAAVATANTASTNASNAVSTANAASTTANSADANATLALNNSRESDGQGGFIAAITKANTAIATANTASTNATSAVNTANAATTTANTASTNASNAVTTANSAASDATSAVSTANTASTNATNAVTTANSAAADATSAVATANTASTNASNAVTTANTADTNATAALNNSRESDGQGGYTSAISKANTAITTANTATAAVSNAVLFDLIANVSSIPGSPSNNDYIEIADSTGIQSFTPLSGLPSGFVGAAGLTVRLRYDSSGTTWAFMNYFANDSETRYVAIGNPNPVYYANQAAFPSATTYHGGIAHSHADGAMYYAHGGNWIKMASDSDVTTNATNIATKLPLAGGTLTGDVFMGDNNSLVIGSGNDLEIQHNGTNTTISNTTGNLYISDTDGNVHIQGKSGEESIVATADGAVDLYHDNSKKLETKSDGIDVTGEVQCDSLDVDGNATFDGDVGIATSSPSLALHVAGPQAYASGPTSLSEVVTKSAARIQGSNDATTSLFFGAETSNANPYIQVANGNGSSSDPLVMQPFGGNAGIGTSSPTVTSGTGLHIAGDTAALKLQNTNNGDWAYVEYADESNTTNFIQGYRDSSGLYAIRPGATLNATTGISLDSSGRVGIANTTPGNLDPGSDDLVVGSGSGDNGITIYSGDSNLGNLYFADGISGSDVYTGGMNYDHSTNSLALFTNGGQTGLRINSDQNVLIGTNVNAPYTNRYLTIGSTSSSGTYFEIRNSTSGMGGVVFSDGTAANDSSYRGIIDYYHGTDTMSFSTSATQRFVFGPLGQFGIGGANYGSSGQVLMSQGSGAAPTWGTATPTIASQAEAEAGTDNTKMMTPLRVAQAIAAQGGSVIASIQRGTTWAVHWPYSATNNQTITSVDTAKSMVLYQGQTFVSTQLSLAFARVQLSNSTTIAVTGSQLTTSAPTVGWEVVEFN